MQWDLESHQCIRRLSMDASGPVHAAILVPRPRALTQPPPAKAVLAPLQPFKKHRVEAGKPGQQQGEGGGAAAGEREEARTHNPVAPCKG